MSDAETQQRPCWCGQRKLLPFSAEYRSCELCGTLRREQPTESALVREGPTGNVRITRRSEL